jgi:glycosyltransferase involved in cell wall biosynthesis
MRIGLITGEYPPMQGGVGAFTRELAVELVAQGHDIHIFTDCRAVQNTPGTPVDAGVTVTAKVNDWNWASLVQARRWARVNALDIVNIQYQAAAFQMAPFVHFLPARLGDIPVVTTFHDLLVPYLFPKAGSLREGAILALARGSQGVIVTNVQDEDQLRRDLENTRQQDKQQPKMRRIPIGSNIPVMLPADYNRDTHRAELDIPPDALLIGYFGFLNASKGIETLLEGVSQALTKGIDAYLLMIGGRVGTSDVTNISFAQQVDKMISALGLRSRVRFTDFVEADQVSAYLTSSDLLVLPYRDGVSFRRGSFMAGIAHSRPIITTHPQITLPEVIDRINAYLIPPDSATALADAIVDLANNTELRTKIGTHAGELAAGFTWECIAKDTVAYFNEILKHR